ncbi:MAG: hypothetical protein ISR65_10965 [Bacteriovoracaceae bacterium]|nr:hypothetical protein [Bacteriovoracaceae bacterium]
MSRRHRYYLKGLLPLLVLIIILNYYSVDLLNIFILASSYLWKYTLLTPGMQIRLGQRKYRFAFLKTMQRIDDHMIVIFQNLKYPKLRPLCRHLPPLILMTIITLTLQQGNIIYSPLGILFYEGASRLVGLGVLSEEC